MSAVEASQLDDRLLTAIGQAFVFLAAFAVLAGVLYLCGMATEGRTSDEIDRALGADAPAERPAMAMTPASDRA
jgi:hypothetical protein